VSAPRPIAPRRCPGANVDRLCDLLKHLRVTGGASKRQLIENELIGHNTVDNWLRKLVENGLVMRSREPCEPGALRSHYVYRLTPAWIGKP
jgi:predicted transcriptional regulator